MSRAPPFPTTSSRARPPPNVNVNGYYQDGTPIPTTPVYPLNVSRPASHAESTSSAASTVRSNGPSRPMRSELRTRVPSNQQSQPRLPPSNGNYRERELGSSRSMSSGLRQVNGDQYSVRSETPTRIRKENISRPSMDSVNSDPYGGYDDGVNGNGYSQASQEQSSPVSPTTPAALTTVLAAFQRAGDRRRGMTYDEEGREMDRERERERERERVHRIQQRQNQRAAAAARTRTGDIDGILDQIQDRWAFVTEPSFRPVELALDLLENASEERDIESFRQTKQRLEQSLRGTIDEHYQEFAASLPHHSYLLSSLTKVQAEVTETRSKLQETRNALGNKRADLVQLWSRGQALEEMMRLLDEIEHLKSVPDILESMISEKRWLQASILLVRSLKSINKGELMEIGALTDLRSYLTGQETALREILIEELQSHLYLKSFWCESRWCMYAPGQQQLPATGSEDSSLSIPLTASTGPPRPTHLTRYLNDLALRPSNENPYDIADDSDLTKVASTSAPPNTTGSGYNTSMSHNPESNSFGYIEALLESLAVLGKLGTGLDSIAQRLPIEIYNLIEGTIAEVRDRTEFSKRSSVLATPAAGTRLSSIYILAEQPHGLAGSASALRLAALEAHSGSVDREPLRDLFWTLYSKLDAVIQGLRVVYEVSNRIGSRRDFKDSSGAKPGTLFPVMDIWMPIHHEVRALLHDYLTDEERGATGGRHPIPSINEVLRENRVLRDKSKAIFRVSNTDNKSSGKSLKKHEDELTRVLKASVPGLVGGATETAIQTPLGALGSDDRYAAAVSHSKLIKPDAFHVTALFQPTLAFLQRVELVMPSGMSDAARAATVYLDEFVLKVYLPLLEEKVATLYHHATGGVDAFQEDSSSRRFSPVPIVKATTQLVALVNSLCAMHQTTPFHRENYSRLILDVIIRFYQRCYDRFVELVALPGSNGMDFDKRIAVSARWAQRPDVSACVSSLFAANETDESSKRRFCRQETRVELGFLATEGVAKRELLPSIKNIAALGSLYHSLTWLIQQLHNLRSLTPDALLSPTSPTETPAEDAINVPTITQDAPPPSDGLSLPLTRAMSMRYEALMKTYEQLAELVIHTIRVEVRCRIIRFIDLAMTQGSYRIDHEAIEPDPYIIDLNTDLTACEECASASLPERERRFVFEGLGSLMDQLFVASSKHIQFANKLGVQKLFRNILALQQNLKTLTDFPDDTTFARARRYYELFSLTPEQLLDTVKEKPQFSFEEYKSMLYLQCGIDQKLSDTDVTDNDVNMYLIELQTFAVDDWEDED